ncbi:hypothetical protein FJZ31_00940 [Candidatus Poribacteria bacterium]|nr:hypothetical protein [Candidatus Poribacteria bacterium]
MKKATWILYFMFVIMASKSFADLQKFDSGSLKDSLVIDFNQPITPLNAFLALEKADFVITGIVKDKYKGKEGIPWMINGQPTTLTEVIVVFQIDGVIKGPKKREVRIVFYDSKDFLLYLGELSKDNQRWLIFLKQHGKRYSLLAPESRMIVYEHPPQYRNLNSSTDKLVEELISTAEHSKERVAFEAVKQLGYFKHYRAHAVLRRLASSKDIVLQGNAFASLLMQGDTSVASDAIRYVDVYSSDVYSAPNNYLINHNRGRILSAISQLNDEKLLPLLYPLTRHGDTYIRRYVFDILRKIPKKSSIPYFIQGLEDADIDIRYTAFWSLAEARTQLEGEGWEGDWHCPSSPEEFQANQTKYIQYWLDWYTIQTKNR